MNSGLVCLICGNAPALVIRSRVPLSAKEARELSRAIRKKGVELLCRECYEQGRCGDLRFIPVKRKKGEVKGKIE